MSLLEDLFYDNDYLAQKFSRKVLEHSHELKNDNEIIKKILNDKISGMEKLLLEILESKK